MGEISATLCNYRDDVDNCCAATSGLGIKKYGVETDVFAAVRNNALDLPLGELTELEWAWVDGYKQGLKDAQ